VLNEQEKRLIEAQRTYGDYIPPEQW
jgi:hypothetical protein